MAKDTFREADAARPCFFCGAPSVYEASIRLCGLPDDERARADEAAWESVKRGEQPAEDVRGVFRITADACPDHEVPLSDALMDATNGGVVGKMLGRSTCPDAFHVDPSDDAYETEAQSIGGSWSETHYACPTCGFATFSTRRVSSGHVSNDAYRFVMRALRKVQTS